MRDKGNFFSFTGPLSDHTSGNGFFAVMRSSSNPPNSKARFFSSIQINSDQTQCLSFWYLMYGADVDSLNIYLDQYDADIGQIVDRKLIWKKSSTSARRWYEVKKTFTSDKPWKLTFEGVVGKSFLSDIAIDDISSVIGILYILGLTLYANFDNFTLH